MVRRAVVLVAAVVLPLAGLGAVSGPGASRPVSLSSQQLLAATVSSTSTTIAETTTTVAPPTPVVHHPAPPVHHVAPPVVHHVAPPVHHVAPPVVHHVAPPVVHHVAPPIVHHVVPPVHRAVHTTHVKTGFATWYNYIPGQCAAAFVPHGVRLYIRDRRNGRTISCIVTDTEAPGSSHIVDLSETQFSQLAPLGKGVVPIAVYW
jgi:hypothetical protein